MNSNLAIQLEPAQSETALAANPKSVEGAQAFAELGLPAALCALVKELGYEVPTPIQIRSIPPLLAGKDLIGQAQTGTGKTAAFALPLLSKIDFKLPEPQILVLAPTRELAIQVAEAFKTYAGRNEAFHVLPIYGGQSISIQLRQLKRRPQVIVGTPGRIMDHLRRGSLSLASLRALVIDEADEMLSMGFLEDMEFIITHTPKEKQTALFSATMPNGVRRIAQAYLKSPEQIVIRQAAAEAALISQFCWFVNGLHKLDALSRILELNEFDAVLIFVRTKLATIEVAEKLEARGYAAGTLNGDMSQEARERTIERLKQGTLDIVVATDVAARGLDVERIDHVINYDLPFDAESYTHRIGRTGRAGKTGNAISFVSDRENGLLRSIERVTGKRLDKYQMPSREDISKRRVEQFKAEIGEALLKSDYSEYLQLVESVAADNETSEKNIAAVLCAMIHRKKPAPKEAPPKELKTKYTAQGGREYGGRERSGRGDRDKKPFRRDTGKPGAPRPGKSDRAPERSSGPGRAAKKAEKNRKWREQVGERP